ADSPAADVELLAFADQLLRELGISEGVQLELNTLGDADSRGAWRAALVEHFEAHRSELSEESLVRLGKNPLRILDSKDPRDRPAADSAPAVDDFLNEPSRAFFEQVTAGLDSAGVAWARNPRLVRGIDYYRHTAFEFVTDRLGSQGAVIAGGRYDGLIETMGGPPTPAVGWAAGIERLSMLIEKPSDEPVELVLIPDEDRDLGFAVRLLRIIREGRIMADMAFSGTSKKRYEKAKRGSALRALTVTSWDVDGLAVLRIRDLKADAPPVRRRLQEALEKHFIVMESDQDRSLTLRRKQ
ncbi:MAG TPA: ATP phosphoribosyltransferase regulatory subunit, partial [Allosphingosinicella sp.]|nr:ATP phosphoribosyltransferase regulatory subunit [Allosphingosinicella sp.]